LRVIFSILLLMSACTSDVPPPDDTDSDSDTDLVPHNPVETAGAPTVIADGLVFTEGPLWMPNDVLLFSDIPANRIYQWNGESLEIFRSPSGNSNGLALNNDGLLLVAEHGNRRISLTAETGEVESLIDSYDGKTLNSPNDLVQSSLGHLYFTDPPYGISEELREISHNGVYRVGPDGAVGLVWTGEPETRPNGIVLSPDESILYVSYTREAVVRAFPLDNQGRAEEGTVFFETAASPDGMTTDAHGNLFITTAEGIQVVNPDGTLWGTLSVDQKPTNCTLGGPKRSTLFVTARTEVYSIELGENP
jgi:gluconolactonase